MSGGGEVILGSLRSQLLWWGSAAVGVGTWRGARGGRRAVRPTVRVLRYGDVTASLHPQAATVFGNSVRFPSAFQTRSRGCFRGRCTVP